MTLCKDFPAFLPEAIPSHGVGCGAFDEEVIEVECPAGAIFLETLQSLNALDRTHRQALLTSNKKLLVTSATLLVTSALLTSNKKLLVTSATLLVTGALLVVARSY